MHGRQFLPCFLDALVDQLPREVDIGAVLEDHRNLRQAVARQRARLLQTRQAGHDGFDRIGDALFGLQRRVAGRGGVDLHLHVGDIGHGVDWQLLVIVDAECGHTGHGEHDQPALLDGKADETFKHDRAFRLNDCARRRPCRVPI